MTTKTRMRLLIIFALSLTYQVGRGQEQQAKRFDLDECIDYALKHEASSLNATLDEEIARLKVKETIGLGLPQVSSSVSVQHSPELQRIFGQYVEPLPGEEGIGFLPPEAAQALGLQDGDAYALQNFFQLPSNGDANLTVDQLIFDGSYIVGLQAAKTYKELSVRQKEYAKGELGAAVAKAYFTVLINQDRLKLYSSNLTRLENLHQETIKLFENGFAEQIEVDRIKVSLNNARTQKSNYENLALLSMRLLKFQMSYPLDQPLELKGSIEDVMNSSINNVTKDFDLANRHDYQAMVVNKELEELNLKNIYAGGIPSISAFATLGYATQSPDFAGLFSTNSGFSEQGGVGPDQWYNYSVVGLRMRWNLFTGLQRNFQIQQQKVKLQKLENDIDQFQDLVSMEVTDAGLTLENALRELQVQQENMELAENIYRVSETKYKQGVGSNLEVIDAENGLQQARTNFYNTLYNAAIAKIDLVRAVGVRD